MLDGKYEITSERELGERVTLFGATAPDGTALSIYWYDLETPADERAFERYRALLRQLRRAGHAAIYDLVSRPGAHYVAWRPPGEADAPPGTTELTGIATVLEAHGRDLNEAAIYSRPDAAPQVYALAFAELPNAPAPVSEATPSTPALPKGVDNLWITVAKSCWTTFRPWSLGGVLALLGVLFLLLGLARSLPDELVEVPQVRGEEVNAALATLREAGFGAAPVGLTSPRPAGTVLEVQPAAGTPLRPGRTLSVRYALPAGRAPGAAPGIVGSTLAQAEAKLIEAGFLLGDVAHSYSGEPAGTVLAQVPAPLAAAAPGERFVLLVSDGPRGDQTFLPDLRGSTLEHALHARVRGLRAGSFGRRRAVHGGQRPH